MLLLNNMEQATPMLHFVAWLFYISNIVQHLSFNCRHVTREHAHLIVGVNLHFLMSEITDLIRVVIMNPIEY